MEKGWLYISFTDKDEKFAGVVMVQQASDSHFKTPHWVVNGLPWEGQMAVFEIPAADVPEDHKYHDRLLGRDELREAVGPIVNIVGEPQ